MLPFVLIDSDNQVIAKIRLPAKEDEGLLVYRPSFLQALIDVSNPTYVVFFRNGETMEMDHEMVDTFLMAAQKSHGKKEKRDLKFISVGLSPNSGWMLERNNVGSILVVKTPPAIATLAALVFFRAA